MSHDLPIPRQIPVDGAATVEWGAEPPVRAGRLHHLRHGLTGNRRMAQVAGGLGAVAAFASLINEWTVTTVPGNGPDGAPVRIPAGVAETDAFGTGYLIGLLVVLGSLALVLSGAATTRRNARAVGLTGAGALLGLLAAAAVTLDETAMRRFFIGDDDRFRVEFGSGLTLGFAATVLLGAAVVLAGRSAGADPARPPRRHEDTDAADPDGPLDLTVSPAPPIIQPPRGYGDRRPTGGDAR